MARKLSFDKLPEAVEKIIGILTAEGSEHAALPELVQRIALLEKKIDRLEKSLSPDRPTMDKHAVLKVLKIRPKMLNELEMAGVLPSHSEGRRTLYYEADVVKFFMTQPSWKGAAESRTGYEKISGTTENSAPTAIPAEGRVRVDINGASEILSRSTGAIRQHLSSGLPHHKDGRRLYFYSDELREWAQSHTPRRRRKQSV